MRGRDESGQATVELVLCMPIAAAILAAALEVGLLGLDHIRLWHAAREAARIAAVTGEEEDIRHAASEAGIEPVTVVISPSPALRSAGHPVSVTVSHERDAMVPLIGMLFSGRLEATAAMRIETP